MKARRYLAWIVTALMLLTSFVLPSSVDIAEAEALGYPELTALAAPEALTEKDDDPSYQCGPNLFWSFNAYTGALTITGSGNMYNYDSDGENPWEENEIATQILSVSLPKGLTSIGDFAFFGCTALQTITLPGAVKSIGEGAFRQCTSLCSIQLPKSVKQIDEYAFASCPSLKEVHYQGKQDDRVKIRILFGNEPLLNAAWHYTKADNKALAIKTQPKSIQVTEGKLATFKVKVVGATTIDWQYRKSNEATWNDAGITADYLSLPGSSLFDGWSFRCRVSNGTATLYSSEATLTVKLVPLAIKTQPKTIKANVGKNVTFKAKVTGATDIDWQYRYPDGSTWYSMSAFSESLSLTADTDYDGVAFRFVAANDRGDVVYSNEVKLCLNIKITQKPKAVKVAEGDLAKFTVVGNGYTGIQWEYQWPGQKTWYEVGNGTYETCTIQTQANYNGVVFRAKLYNSSTVKYSAKAKLTVTRAAGSADAYRALLIGENAYTSSNPLKGCVNDMNAMAGMLQGLSNSFTTKILPNSTKKQIINGIHSAFAGATDKSVSLFYYSGHGLKHTSSSTNHGALVPIDEQYITFSELAKELSKVKGRVIVILDSCFSGASINKAVGEAEIDDMIESFTQDAIEAFSGYRIEADEEEVAKYGELANKKFIVITAASKTETSADGAYDGSGYRQGKFTASIIKGMGCKYPKGAYSGSMPADSNGDKKVTLSEIFNYAYNNALKWGNAVQHAQYYGPSSEVLFSR